MEGKIPSFLARIWNDSRKKLQIKNNDLIKLEPLQEPEIFATNDVGIEQIDLANTYFIIDGV